MIPEEDRRALSSEERERAAEQRERSLDARQHSADQRDQQADQRDAAAAERDQQADQRDRDLLSESAAARLHARLETMPVIEQAKGMIMEQMGCSADDAFDVLRQASQRSNVPVREIAVRIISAQRQPKTAPRPHDPRSGNPAL